MTEIEPAPTATPVGLVALTLVPVEVFGTEVCCEHGPSPEPGECRSIGYGLMDAVESWSDCNRASGRIYRVDDSPSPREPGDSVTIYVAEADAAWFEKRWGEQFEHGQCDAMRQHVQVEPGEVLM